MQYVSNITFAELKHLNILPGTKIKITIEQRNLSREEMLAAMRKLRGSGDGKGFQRLMDERLKERSTENR